MSTSLPPDKTRILRSVSLFLVIHFLTTQWPTSGETFDFFYFWIKLSSDIAKALIVSISPYLYLGSGTWKIQLLNTAILLGTVSFFHQLALNLIQAKKRVPPSQ